MGFSATLAIVTCPACGAEVVMATVDQDGLLSRKCESCGATIEKRRGQEPKAVKPC